MAVPGPAGPPGPPGPTGPPGSSYEHTQSTPAATWIIDHNLDIYPSVSLIISGVLVDADVIYGSRNQVTIVFPNPQSGMAVLN